MNALVPAGLYHTADPALVSAVSGGIGCDSPRWKGEEPVTRMPKESMWSNHPHREGPNGNISADRDFCDAERGDFTLDGISPCLPGHHPSRDDRGLIGAFGQGCGVIATERTT